MYPIHTHLPVPPHPSVFFTLVASTAKEISKRNNKNKVKTKVKHSNKNIKTNKIPKSKPTKKTNKQTKPTWILHLSCLSIASSFFLVTLEASVYDVVYTLLSKQLYLQLLFVQLIVCQSQGHWLLVHQQCSAVGIPTASNLSVTTHLGMASYSINADEKCMVALSSGRVIPFLFSVGAEDCNLSPSLNK